jgi:hypothetical protein
MVISAPEVFLSLGLTGVAMVDAWLVAENGADRHRGAVS